MLRPVLRAELPTSQWYLAVCYGLVGINMLVAISAPTGLAIRLANETNLTLIGFARGDQHVVYTHPHRLTHNSNVL